MSVFCELAALTAPPEDESLPPEELLGRVVQSYQGVLEFAGEQFSKERLDALLANEASLEKFFEPVVNGDQRSTVLNEMLTRIGDWVLLEAEDRGLRETQMRTRFQEVIRAHLSLKVEETVRTDEVRQKRKKTVPLVRRFTPYPGVNSPIPVEFGFLRNGQLAVTSSASAQSVDVWDLASSGRPKRIGSLKAPAGLNPNWREATFQSSSQGDRLVVQYGKTGWVQVWDSRKLTLIQEQDFGGRFVFSSISPQGNYLALAAARSGDERTIYLWDLRGGAAEPQSVGGVKVEMDAESAILWAPDESRVIFRTRGKRNRFFHLLVEVSGSTGQATSLPNEEEIGVLAFGSDRDHVLRMPFSYEGSHLILSKINLTGTPKFEDVWTDQPAAWLSRGRAEIWSLRRAAGEVIAFDGDRRSLTIRDLATGDLLHEAPVPEDGIEGPFSLSPSERYLSFSSAGHVYVLDLETRLWVSEGRVYSPYQTQQIRYSADEKLMMLLSEDDHNHTIEIWSLDELRDGDE